MRASELALGRKAERGARAHGGMTTLGLLRSGPRSWPELAKGADVVALALELDRLEKTHRVVKTRTADGKWNMYAARTKRG